MSEGPISAAELAEHELLRRGYGVPVTVDPEALGETEEAQDNGLVPVYWPDFWKREHPEEDWLVEPLIPRGRQVVIWAIHKTGKSLLALEVAAALATGRSCLGAHPGLPVPVVYLDMEMTEDDLYERLSDFGYGPEVDLDRLRYYLLPALAPLDTADGAEALAAMVEAHHPAVVVIDTMAGVVAGEENDADTYRNFSRLTGRRLRAAGVSLLRLDHGGKDPTKDQRGSSAKGDDVDVVWRLETTEGGLTLVRKAARMGWVPERVNLNRCEDPHLCHRLSAVTDWPAGTKEAAGLLNGLVGYEPITRRKAAALLREKGHRVSNEVIGKALKYRKDERYDPQGLI